MSDASEPVGLEGDVGRNAPGAEEALPTALDSLLALTRSFPEPEIKLGDLVDGLSDRAFGFVLLVLAIPCCVPFLYGIPQIVALPMILLCLQIAVGRHTPWLPNKLRERTVNQQKFEGVILRAKKYLGWAERITRPRFSFLTRGVPERLFGTLMVLFSAVILIPLPGTNTTPGFAIAIMSLGLIERDGLLMGIGTVIGLAWCAFLLTAGSLALGQVVQWMGF